jgi:hypothetical protein
VIFSTNFGVAVALADNPMEPATGKKRPTTGRAVVGRIAVLDRPPRAVEFAMLGLRLGGRLAAIGTGLRLGIRHVSTTLGQFVSQELPRHFVPNFAGKLFELDERASRPKPTLLDLGKLLHNRRNPGF